MFSYCVGGKPKRVMIALKLRTLVDMARGDVKLRSKFWEGDLAND